MSEIQSKIIQKIVEIDLENRFFKPVIVRGKDYYNKKHVKEIYSPRYNELVAKVIGTEDYYVHIYLDKNVIKYDCSCPYEYNCKHLLAVLYAIRSNPSKYDELCNVIEPVRSNPNPTIQDMLSFLFRLIGPNYIVSGYVEGEFNIYFNRAIKLINTILESSEDKYLCGGYINDILTLASTVVFYNTTYQIKLERDIYPLINRLCNVNPNYEFNLLKGLTEKLNQNSILLLIDGLKNYFDSEKKETKIYVELINSLSIHINKFSNIDFSDLIILKARNLFLNSKEDFIKYASNYSYIDEIRIMLLNVYHLDKKYDEVINIYEKFNIDYNINEFLFYISALIKSGNDYYDRVIEAFENNPSYDLYIGLKNLDIFKNDNIKEKIKDIALSNKDFEGKTKVVSELGDIKEVYRVCMSISNSKIRIDSIHNNIKDLIGINDSDLIKTYQDDIVNYYKRTSNLRSTLKYIDDFSYFKLGDLYKYNLLLFIHDYMGLFYADERVYETYLYNLGI